MKVRRRVADPDAVWVYCSLDYAQLELATTAQCCINLGLESELAKAINAGHDLHVRLGARVQRITYAEGLALKKAKDPGFLKIRQSMKPINYGKAGLMGPPKMVYTARKDGIYFCEAADGWKGEDGRGCAQKERLVSWGKGANAYQIPPTCAHCVELAKAYGDAWYEEWTEMRDYHEITIAAAKESEHGQPFDSFGTGMLRLEPNANAASNHFFQNLAAQGAKHAAWLLSKEMYATPSSPLYNNGRLVVFVHDEAFCEFREPVAHECGWRASEILKKGMEEYTPDVTQVIEPALARRWFKGMETVKDRNGRLKPWWPKDWAWGPDQELMAADLAA